MFLTDLAEDAIPTYLLGQVWCPLSIRRATTGFCDIPTEKAEKIIAEVVSILVFKHKGWWLSFI